MAFEFFNIVFEGVLSGVVISFILGVLHGITPDEHTWPITFAYAIGSYSTKKGAEVGMVFSAGFTIQRALMSEVFYIVFNNSIFSIRDFLQSSLFFAIVYIVVGFVMGVAGYYIKYGRWYPHIGLDRFFGERIGRGFKHQEKDFYSRNVSIKMAMVHGLIAGFGMGAFALIIFTVIAPNMPNVYLGFLPGLMFGLGTMTMQMVFGAGFGAAMLRIKKLTRKGLDFLAHYMSSSVLLYGGITFMVAGLASIAFPMILDYGVNTGIPVYNLDSLNLGFFLVIATVGIIGIGSYIRGIRLAVQKR